MDVNELQLKIRRVTFRPMASFHILMNLGGELDFDLMAETIQVLDY
jgi:hypothetical protein